jgi:hypothetical protein
MKILPSIIFSMFLCSCTTKNILNYKKHLFYNEKISYQVFSNTIVLRQSISYDIPKSSDEEYAFGTTIMIKEKFLTEGRRFFDIVKDSIYYFHQLPKISFSESRSYYKFIGNIQFLEWDSAHVVLKENIQVIDSLSRVIKIYKGKRKFKRAEGNLKLGFD